MAEPAPDRVLLVDDEPDLVQLVRYNLEQAGFEVTSVGSGAEGLLAAARMRPAVVVLDVMLPDLQGTEVCRRLRADDDLGDIGIVMLTARGDEGDRVLGFEVGADDYVVKPFSVRELVLRVRALSRRTSERRSARASVESGRRLRWRELDVDTVRHRVHVAGSELNLRPLEFKLVALFLERPGQVLTRAQLLEEVWGITADLNTRTVDTHVRRLRDKLGTYGDAIETVHGFGYRLREA